MNEKKRSIIFGICFGSLLLIICIYFLTVSILDFMKTIQTKPDNQITNVEKDIPLVLGNKAEKMLPFIAKTAARFENNGSFGETEIVYTVISYLNNEKSLQNGERETSAISKGDLNQYVTLLNPHFGDANNLINDSDETGFFQYTIKEENGIYIFEYINHLSSTIYVKEASRKYENKKIIVSYNVYYSDVVTGIEIHQGQMNLIFEYEEEEKDYVFGVYTYTKLGL